jgi:hypothetical protein
MIGGVIFHIFAKIRILCSVIAGRVREPRRIVIPGQKEVQPPLAEDLHQKVEVPAEALQKMRALGVRSIRAEKPKVAHAVLLATAKEVKAALRARLEAAIAALPVHTGKAVTVKDQHVVHLTKAVTAKDQHAVHSTIAVTAKDLHVAHSTKAVTAKDLHVAHSTKAVTAKDQHVVHSIKAVTAKDQLVVHSIKAVTAKDRHVVPMKELLTAKAITIASLQQKHTRAANLEHPVLMEAFA